MTAVGRVTKILTALFSILFAVLMIRDPEDGYALVVPILGITLLVYGIRLLVYYFSMARFMVDGRMVFYKGIILLDLGLFTGLIAEIPMVYGMIYLVGGLVVSGVLDVMRAFEAKKLEGSWKRTLVIGILKILIIIPSLMFMDSLKVLVYIYCFGLINTAVGNIISAFRKTYMVSM